ncbi:MAG TPA: SLC13 family permease, partial [bacterium]|nr:SLC13 family permease [bacterium]
ITPIPFIISQVIASNIGGTATLIGDPPNIMIGSAAGLSFIDFIIHLSPLILILILVFSAFSYFAWGSKMVVTNERKARIMEFKESEFIQDKPLLIKSLIVLALLIIGFIFHGYLHLEAATIALTGASLLMLMTGKKEMTAFFHEIEWETIFFFIGLFIMVSGLVETGVIKTMADWLMSYTDGNIEKASYIILWSSGIFSGFIDNIPFVATMIPLIKQFGVESAVNGNSIIPIWWSLALGACLGGNATLIGASANVVSAGISAKNGYKISFWEFTKYGAIITLINLFVCNIYIYLRYF